MADRRRRVIPFLVWGFLARLRTSYVCRFTKQRFKVSDKGNGFSGTTADGDPLALELAAHGDTKITGKLAAVT